VKAVKNRLRVGQRHWEPSKLHRTAINHNKEQHVYHVFIYSSFIIIRSFIHGMISFKSIAIQFMASSWAIRLTGGASLLAANALRTQANPRCVQSHKSGDI